jgi:hypothetical protein
MKQKAKWFVNEEHPVYGTVKAMGVREGEPYRMFLKDGSVSLVPLQVLEDLK